VRPLIRAFGLALGPVAASFRRALAHPAEAQARLKEALWASAKQTEYGRSIGRDAPIADYESLRPWIERQRDEGGAICVSEPLLFWEKTSGSRGPAKYIPYTRGLKRSFSRMFAIWAEDLIRNGPPFRSGKLYLSISPDFAAAERTGLGARVGLEDDRDYLEGPLRWALSPFFIAPPGLAKVRDPEQFRRKLALCLLAEPRLEIFSIWNPSFLLVLLELISAERETLLRGLSPQRARALEEAFRPPRPDFAQIWPELKLVSAWGHGHAAPLFSRLAEALPQALHQPKGLLATEAPITLPMVGAAGGVPLVDEVLLELLRPDGSLAPLAELEVGEEGELIVSQKGGFLRYRLGDRVRVGPRFLATPTLDFLGRAGMISDLVGEKLEEGFVVDALSEAAITGAAVRALIPVRSPRDHYVLLLDGLEGSVAAAEERLETALSRAHHYQRARHLAQLSAVRVKVHPRAAELLADAALRRGMRLGDLKPSLLELVPADAVLSQELSRE
jgi:hypothetical protein